MASPPRWPAWALPVSNRPATLMGVDITLTVIAFFAVTLRVYTRFKLKHGLGWDDGFIVLAIFVALTGSVCVCLSTRYGLGQHISQLTFTDLEDWLHIFYVMNGTYVLSTALIKISLLFQYLRLFTPGVERRVSQVLLVVVIMWGFAYSFIAWFPCFPVDAYWNLEIPDHNGKCYGFGIMERKPFVATYESQAATNMTLDLIVFSIPMLLLWRKQAMSTRQRLTTLGIFILGLSVIVVAIARLAVVVHYQAGYSPMVDWTWYAPNMIICSDLEIGLAMLTASAPIFWPVIEASIDAVFVTREVHVEAHRRSIEDAMEMDESADIGSSGGSEAELSRQMSAVASFKESFLSAPDRSKGSSVLIEAQPKSVGDDRLV